MFSYYGSKSKVIDLYPSPKHKRVIEPFAGSARYAMKYHWCDVLLVDKYETVVNVWKWLQSCTAKDILDLPHLKTGDSVKNYNLPQPAKEFLGFLVVRGMESPRENVSSFVGDITPKLIDISKKVSLIKHWEIRLGSYADIQNETATWFIDPPYQFGGEHYIHSNESINFQSLAEWCKSRNGQVIVCENTKADWLPFCAMREMNGSQHTTVEAIWSNMPHDFEYVQLGLFTQPNTASTRQERDVVGDVGFE